MSSNDGLRITGTEIATRHPGLSLVHSHPIPLRAFKTRQSCELHAFTTRSHVRSFACIFRIFQESPRCPAVVSQDHAVCLTTEHSERNGSPRSHEVRSGLPFKNFFTDRSTVVFASIFATTPCSLLSWLDQEFCLRRHCMASSMRADFSCSPLSSHLMGLTSQVSWGHRILSACFFLPITPWTS